MAMARVAPTHEAERKLLLLKAAFREVAEKGFSDVTLSASAGEIVGIAGVSATARVIYCGLSPAFRASRAQCGSTERVSRPRSSWARLPSCPRIGTKRAS